jgi:lambda family phage portal protein
MRKLLQFVKALFWWKYEGAEKWSDKRGFLPGWLQDAREDLDNCTREELVRKCRALEKNNAFVNRLADLFEQFTVGSQGLQIIPDSTDDNWNESTQQEWDDWGQYCDLTSLQGIGCFMSLAARRWFIEGECWIHLTRGETGLTRRGVPVFRPRIELIESHRIRTPESLANQEGRTIWDGVEVDPRGRPVAYHVAERISDPTTSATKFRRIPAEEMIPVMEPSRPGQYRGEPFLTSCINDILDLRDLQYLEMLAAKDAAEVSNVLTNETGELSPAALRRSRTIEKSQDSGGNETSETRTQYVKTVLGGRTIALKRGETLTQHRSDRPSVTMQWYWDYLLAKVCSGAGISPLLVMARSLQGTVARGELDSANAFFQARSSVLQAAFKRVYAYWVEWSVQFDPRLDGAPADGSWRRVESVGPPSVNVDSGYNSAALIAEVKAGHRTYSEIYGRRGLYWKKQFRQIGREQKFIDQVASENGISPGRMVDSIGEALKLQLDQENQQRQLGEQLEEQALTS